MPSFSAICSTVDIFGFPLPERYSCKVERETSNSFENSAMDFPRSAFRIRSTSAIFLCISTKFPLISYYKGKFYALVNRLERFLYHYFGMQILSGEFSFFITETDDGHRNIVHAKMTIRVKKRERGHKQDSAPKRRGILAFLQSEVLYENRGEQHDSLPFQKNRKEKNYV